MLRIKLFCYFFSKKMEELCQSITRDAKEGLNRLVSGQAPHSKTYYCHEENWDYPSNLLVTCRICGHSVDTPPSCVTIQFTSPS